MLTDEWWIESEVSIKNGGTCLFWLFLSQQAEKEGVLQIWVKSKLCKFEFFAGCCVNEHETGPKRLSVEWRWQIYLFYLVENEIAFPLPFIVS